MVYIFYLSAISSLYYIMPICYKRMCIWSSIHIIKSKKYIALRHWESLLTSCNILGIGLPKLAPK